MITIKTVRTAVLAVAAAASISMAMPTIAAAHGFGGGHVGGGHFGGGHFGGGHFGWGGHIGGWGGHIGGWGGHIGGWGGTGLRLGYVGYPGAGDYGCPYGYLPYRGLCYPRPAYTAW